jgi:hypothetical protein
LIDDKSNTSLATFQEYLKMGIPAGNGTDFNGIHIGGEPFENGSVSLKKITLLI